MKFLCDQMLGTLAKWLRIYGFDTFFADSEINDDELLDIAKSENRILVTRDKELAFRANSKKIKNILLVSIELDEQIKRVLRNIDIDKELFLTRCLICNSNIVKINKNKVKGKVAERVFENNNEFFYCKNCDKLYWKGTHYKKMKDKIEDLV